MPAYPPLLNAPTHWDAVEAGPEPAVAQAVPVSPAYAAAHPYLASTTSSTQLPRVHTAQALRRAEGGDSPCDAPQPAPRSVAPTSPESVHSGQLAACSTVELAHLKRLHQQDLRRSLEQQILERRVRAEMQRQECIEEEQRYLDHLQTEALRQYSLCRTKQQQAREELVRAWNRDRQLKEVARAVISRKSSARSHRSDSGATGPAPAAAVWARDSAPMRALAFPHDGARLDSPLSSNEALGAGVGAGALSSRTGGGRGALRPASSRASTARRHRPDGAAGVVATGNADVTVGFDSRSIARG